MAIALVAPLNKLPPFSQMHVRHLIEKNGIVCDESVVSAAIQSHRTTRVWIGDDSFVVDGDKLIREKPKGEP